MPLTKVAFKGATLCVLALSLLLAGAQSVLADRLLRNVRDWSVVQSDEYKGCIAVATYRDQTKVRVGYDGVSSLTFINFSNPNWGSLPLDVIYEIAFDFENEGRFSGFFRARLRESVFTLENGEVTASFMRAFADAHRVRMFIEGRRLTTLELSGTRAAIDAVENCRH